MYQQAVDRLIAAADQVVEYRGDLAAFADTLAGKRWGAEVTGEIQDMTGELTALEGDYRDLAARMRHQGDQGSAAHEQAPWVPDTLLDEEYSTCDATGSPAMADNVEPGPTFETPVDAAAIAARLREIDTVDEGRAYLAAQHLDKQGLLAVAAALGLSRLERKSAPEIKRRIITHAIIVPAFTPTPFEAPPPEVLETGPYAQHKLPDPDEDQECRDLIAEYFDPMQGKDPRSLKVALETTPDDQQRDAWNRRADEVAHAWGSSLHGPGSLFEYIEPVNAGTDSGRQPDVAEPPQGTTPTTADVVPEPAPAASPAPVAPAPAATPVSGWPSDKRIAENTWGGAWTKDSVHYHDDGPIGTAICYMGRQDAQMDVDGEPLANVLGQVATDVVRGRRTAQQAVDDLKVLRDRLPEASNARTCLGRAIEQMDAPVTPVPAVPEGTPEPLRQAVQALHAIPIVRREPEKELEPLLALAEKAAADPARTSRLVYELRALRNKRHESYGDAGKFEIDRAIDAAFKALS